MFGISMVIVFWIIAGGLGAVAVIIAIKRRLEARG
jgi:hypothetical protein